jgi:hypothetical protein
MKDSEIIEKSIKALKELGLYNRIYENVSVIRTYDKLLLEAYPEIDDYYTVSFPANLPDGRGGAGLSVKVDKKTNKLVEVITRNSFYKIPEEFQ